MLFPPPVVRVVVDHLHAQTGLFEEGCNAVWTAERSREKKENRFGSVSRLWCVRQLCRRAVSVWRNIRGARSDRYSGRLVLAGVDGGHGDRRVGSWRGLPREDVLVEVDFRSEYDAQYTGHVNAVSSRCAEAAP
eukprot:5267918-Pleurochrysis_carterae.AAC.1